jgi:hypothetical protein
LKDPCALSLREQGERLRAASAVFKLTEPPVRAGGALALPLRTGPRRSNTAKQTTARQS